MFEITKEQLEALPNATLIEMYLSQQQLLNSAIEVADAANKLVERLKEIMR
jgi:hypothetical protein